uniref:Uncharacterized protein n=1 Tax=Opuntia streptacantha TaxID=393608 RepID=A0A7C9DZM0_OPUST
MSSGTWVAVDFPQLGPQPFPLCICQWMDPILESLHACSKLPLLLETHPESLLHILGKVGIKLAITSKSHHDLRKTQGKVIPTVDLPKVDGLAIGLSHLSQVLALHGARDRTREEEDPALDLVLVGVPEPLLRVWEGHEEVLRYDVLNPDKPGVCLRAIVDQALPHLLVLVPTEVVCLYLSCHVVPVKVEPDCD